MPYTCPSSNGYVPCYLEATGKFNLKKKKVPACTHIFFQVPVE